MAGKEIIGEKEKTRYIQFYQEIIGARSTFKSKHQKDLKIDDEIIKRRSKEGKHLIDTEKIEIDEKFLDELLQVLCPVLKKYEAFSLSEIQELMQNREKIDFARLTRSVLIGDSEDFKSIANQLNLNPDLLSFMGLNLVQVFLELYSEKIEDKIDPEGWYKGNCPICGSFPAMEKLRRDDGKRILWCGLCGTQWPYKRLMCPFCGNEDHNSLRYFFTEGDLSSDSSPEENPFRVDVCDKCKKYIKTIDERKMPENKLPDFSKENINTVYLDVLAQKDGYESPTYLKTQILGGMIAPSEKESV